MAFKPFVQELGGEKTVFLLIYSTSLKVLPAYMGRNKNHSKVFHIFLTVFIFILLYFLYNLHQVFIYLYYRHYTIINQVWKCNGTFYRGNAGEDT